MKTPLSVLRLYVLPCALLGAAISYTPIVSASWLDNLKGLKDQVSEATSDALDKKSANNSADTSSQSITGNLSLDDLNQGFKQALDLGSQRVVEQLAKTDGFNGDSAIRIGLPSQMQTVKQWLGKVGMDSSLDSFEVSLNRAAEHAAPKAKALFIDTIQKMTFEDIQSIYKGSEDAATRYFQEKMSPALKQEMAPMVQESLSEVGAVKLYDKVIQDYESIPFVPDIKANLVEHVVDGGLTGIFHYLAKEEAEIRKNPVKRTTELLQRVFGQ